MQESHEHHERHEHHNEHRHLENHERHNERRNFDDHEHSAAQAPASKEELLALLSYMVSHNRHHAQELSELAASAEGDAKNALEKAISLFSEGNAQLQIALDQMKNQA